VKVKEILIGMKNRNSGLEHLLRITGSLTAYAGACITATEIVMNSFGSGWTDRRMHNCKYCISY